jgi:hypothetical protein
MPVAPVIKTVVLMGPTKKQIAGCEQVDRAIQTTACAR